jgi:hypothetical protein
MEIARLIVDFILSKGRNLPYEEKFMDIHDGMKIRRKTKFKFSSISKTRIFHEPINFFPSSSKGRCCSTAVFVCVKPSTLDYSSDPSNHVDFETVVKKMVQQILGGCFNRNKDIILITDNFDTEVIKEWKPNFKAMTQVCNSINICFFDSKGNIYDINHFFGI